MSEKISSGSIIDDRNKEIKRLKKRAKIKEIPDEFLEEHDYFRSLLEITHSINMPRDFKQLLELIVDSAINLSEAERGFLMLFNRDGNLEFRVTRNFDKETLENEKFGISKTVVNHVLTTGEALFLSDIYKNKKFKISESIETLGLRMVMCVPLKTKENFIGVIYVDSHIETEKFTKLKEKIFEAFAAQTSVAIENSHLYDLSVHDNLTGLYNYAYLRTRLEEEIKRALRSKKESISFIMLDLDNFKSINDSYGHVFGNTILVKVAELIKETVRKYDIPARYGGDEFAVLMPDADEQDARSLAQRLQENIDEMKLVISNKTIPIASSIGIATFPVEKIIDSESIIIEADHALFVAKSKGGNQIIAFKLRKDEKKPELELIGTSKAMDEVRMMISKFARTDATVLIIGETGTGKEIVTHLIHKESSRAKKPLVVVNCGAIPDNLLESELFGYEKGAFTGAYRQHKGKFEVAQDGIIFLDEIGELPLHLQVKLLRALEQKEIDRIGGKSPIKVDVRIIAASNRDLEDEVKKGNFRKDLFYRLSVATIHVPSLKERPEDIEVLTEYYLNQMNTRYQKKFLGFTKSALEAMLSHFWPGNVRELIHRIERAIIMGGGQYIDEKGLGLTVPKFRETKTLKESRAKTDRDCIMQMLIQHQWNMTQASKELGITRKTLGALMKRLNIKKIKQHKKSQE